MGGSYLTNQLLVAMPSLADPNFSHSVTLVCEHNDRGALGIVINRPLEMRMSEVLDQLSLSGGDARLREMPVLAGGPVQRDRGFVLHRPAAGPYESTMPVSDTLWVTTSRDVLTALAAGDGPPQAVMALGYAGWEAGQLEDEVRQNAWLTVPCDDALVFELPYEQRWHAAARLLGVELSRISSQAGRA
ncbi:MAG: YqgE/AlgH family protein [Gammaproteobacteria bacterium]